MCAHKTFRADSRASHTRRALAFTLILIVYLASLLVVAPRTAARDTVTGAFEGTVTNSLTGEAIADAAVQIVFREKNLTIEKRSDARGRFYQGLLEPGIYLIRVSAPGFQTKEVLQRLFVSRTGEVVPVPVALDPDTSPVPTGTASPTPGASPTSSPSPTAGTPSGTATSAPALSADETDIRARTSGGDASRGGSFTEEEIVLLPLGATTITRSFDELTLLLPGVAPPPQTFGNGAGPGVGSGVGTAGQFSVNGLRSRANNFTVDGSDNNDEDIGVRRQGFLALIPQPIESIREYQAITLLAPAQFGRNLGAQVNAVSKSGGNETHGTIYGFFNSSQLNARNFFDSTGDGATTPLRVGNQSVFIGNAADLVFDDRTLNFVGGAPVTVRDERGGEDSFSFGQGGFVLGGPIKRDRMFYFVSAEGQVINATNEQSFAVPTVPQRGAFGSGASGIFRDPFSDEPEFAFPTTAGGDAIFSLFPFPNNPTGVYGENTFTQILPADARGLVLSAKYDANFRFRERLQTATGRYNFTDDRRTLPVTGGALFSSLRPRVRTQNFSFFFNSEVTAPDSLSPVFNQVRLSYGRTRLNFREVRDTQFLLPSDDFPETPFLLNAPFIANATLPDVVGDNIVPNAGTILYASDGTTVEQHPSPLGRLGPVGQVVIAGFSPVGVDVFNFPQSRINNTYQLADELTYRRASHNFTFGVDTRRTELNSDLPRNFRPLITFYGAPELGLDEEENVRFTGDFLRPIDLAAAGAASGFFQTLTNGDDAAINLRFYQLNFYAGDQWRIRPNLSLSYGLRYEYNTPPRETSRRVEDSFDDAALDFVPGLRTFISDRERIFDPDRNNFAPRVGLAYSQNFFGANRATVFRAGYGLFYDQILGAVVSQSRSVFPRFLTVNLAGGLGNIFFDPDNIGNPVAALGLLNPATSDFVQRGTLNRLNPESSLADQITIINCIASAGGANCNDTGDFNLPGASGVEVTLPARRLDTPSAHHYTFTVEQRLGTDTVLSAAYVGTQGRNLLRFTTPNLGSNAVLLPLAFNAGVENLNFQPSFFGVAVAPGTGVTTGGDFTGGRPEPTVGGVQLFETTAESRYDSLQLQLRGRFRRSLQYSASYTFSKAIDDVSDVFELAGAPALPQNSLTFEGERAPANFDARHRFSYNFIYDLPSFNDRGPAFRFFFGGLQFAGTGRLQSGQPFTVNTYIDVNLDGNITDRINTLEGLERTGDRRQPLVLTTTDTTSLLAPVGEDGAIGRNAFRGGNMIELDLAVVKRFALTERQNIQFRAEAFNFINRANFGVPVRVLESPAFGGAVNTVTPGRRIQFSLKYSF